AGHGEVPLPTYPARTFVSAGNVAVLAEHTIEYELLEERELAITVLRATGLISRNANPHREDPAGPEIAIPGGQCRGPWSYAFGIRPHAGDWAGAELLRDADRYAHPFLAAPGTADAAVPLPDGGMGLSVDGRGVTVSALRRIEEELELRLACEDPDAQLAVIRGRFSAAREVDLLGHEVGVVAVASGEVRLPMGAWEIRTLRLR
ncbi:MAG: alpha-mannosidase, partial [Chloroflexota bacterium]|nr:alpha-mannosidase [Chloroflexota bacterium]